MVRILGGLIGLFFAGWLMVSFGFGAIAYVTEETTESAEEAFHLHAKPVHFSSDGPLGHFDKTQLQRGFKVYQEVCAACHSLRLVSFRNLEALGYNEEQIKTIAANWPIQVPDVDPDTGEITGRAGLPADKFPKPFANDVAAAAANNNAIPPDLSLITKAREGGAPYIYSLLTGYADPATYKNAEGKALPKEAMPGAGLHFNPYFANLNLAMAAPLTGDGQVTYDDGTKSTIDQMAKDVSAFLIWTAEPTLVERKQTGWAVIAFLLVATILAFMSYQTIWADVKAEKKKKAAKAA